MGDLRKNDNFIHNKYGHCYYSLDDHLIYNLYVHQEYRRQGHSKVLLEYAINEIRKTGYTGEIKVEAIPREDSISKENLIAYYKSMNLTIINI
jgi:GNAT superfamily N-acetyltransferase